MNESKREKMEYSSFLTLLYINRDNSSKYDLGAGHKLHRFYYLQKKHVTEIMKRQG